MREQVASFYIYSISFLGLIAVMISLFLIEMPSHFVLLLLLIMFMGITEYFPIRIWRGGITLSLTLIYTMNWQFGMYITVVSCVGVMLSIQLFRRLPMQRTVFNCAQLALSIVLAEWFSRGCFSFFISGMNLSVLYEKFIILFLFSAFLCLFNSLFYDLLIILLLSLIH